LWFKLFLPGIGDGADGGAYSARVAAIAASNADLASLAFFSSIFGGPSLFFLASASAVSFAIRSLRSASSYKQNKM
jgi:hypothetical protein